MTTQLKQLIKLARKVRTEVVSLGYYNKTTLDGACGTASYHLMRCAKKNGISVRFVYGYFWKCNYPYPHAWVEYQGHIIDLTKRQFDLKDQSPTVAVIPIEEAVEYRHNNVKVRTPLIKESWKWIRSWAYYPDSLKKNLILL